MNHVHSLAQLFSERVFVVPEYQRGYSWEARQVSELLDDLETLPDGRDHYTGTLVLHRDDEAAPIVDDAGNVYVRHDVVDGQQRLTTLVILLYTLAEELGAFEQAEPLRTSTRATYVSARDQLGLPLYKHTLNADSKAFFRDEILGAFPVVGGPTIASHQRLLDTKTALVNHFAARRAALESGYLAYLRRMHRAVTSQMKWTLYEVDSAADVGVIFEVMNDRGKPLSELDKVKNYLMYVGSKLVDFDDHELDDDVNAAWAHLFRELMAAHLSATENEDELLRSHWRMAYDPQPRRWQGARSVKERIRLSRENDPPTLISGIREYAKSLSQASVAFADVRSPGRPGAFNSYAADEPSRSEIARWGDRLVRLRVLAPFIPLLMAFRHRSPSDGTHYLNLLRLLELFAFRVYSVLGRRVDVGQSELFRLAHEVFSGDVDIELAQRRVRGLLLHLCPNDEFERQLTGERNWYEWGGLVYFLYEFERDLARRQGAEPDVSWQQLRQLDRNETIEHVLPQTPSHDYWTSRFTADEFERCTHSLGNLTLTKDNSSYGNKPYPLKRGEVGAEYRSYMTGLFHMERELANSFVDWTPEAIETRARELVEWALGRWHVEDRDLDDEEVSTLVVVEPETTDEGSATSDAEPEHEESLRVGVLPTLASFTDFVETVVLPIRAIHPDWARLDGWESGGNMDVVGTFSHGEAVWKVHADTHFEPLLIAYESAREGRDPFRRSTTRGGTSTLELTEELNSKRSSARFKHLYIYRA